MAGMSTRLKNVVSFVAVPAAGTATLAHGLNINNNGVLPDSVFLGAPGFEITATTSTDITIQNNNAAPADCDVLVEHWHTIERAFGQLATGDATALSPQPFVAAVGTAAGGGGGGGFVPQAGPNFLGIVPALPSGRAVFVNPGDATAADDGNCETPKLTITGAIAAIVAAGPPATSLEALTRWTLYVAAGCYDEDVTVPVTVPHLTMVSMGGVTLGDGDATTSGGSTTPRNFLWEVNGDYLTAGRPANYLALVTIAPNGLAADWGDFYAVGLSADYASQGWRISGDLTVQQGAGSNYPGAFLPFVLASVFVEGNTNIATGLSDTGIYSAVSLDNCVFVGDFINTANGYLVRANNSLFNQNYNNSNFYTGSAFSLSNCKWYSATWEIQFASGAFLTNCQLYVSTLVAWGNGNTALRVDDVTAQAIAALGRTIVPAATAGPLDIRSSPTELVFGNSDIGAAAGTVFLTPGYQAAAAGAADDRQVPAMPNTAGNDVMIITGISARHNLGAGNGNAVVYEVLVNGSPLSPAMTVSVPSNSTTQLGSSADPAFLTSSSRISVRAVKAASIGSGVLNAVVAVRAHIFTRF
jgi:hypothetical protein